MATKKTAKKSSAKEEYVWIDTDDEYVSEPFPSVEACLKHAEKSVAHLSKEAEVLVYKLVARASVVQKLEVVNRLSVS